MRCKETYLAMANPNSYNRPTLAPRYAGNSILLSNNYPRAASYPYSTFKHILSRPRPRPLAFRSTSAQAFPTIAEQEDMDQGLQMGKHDLDCAKLNGLLCELQKHNRQGQIVTYDRSRGPLAAVRRISSLSSAFILIHLIDLFVNTPEHMHQSRREAST